jgi:hypothetical protein
LLALLVLVAWWTLRDKFYAAFRQARSDDTTIETTRE